jgi:hypothetical protein
MRLTEAQSRDLLRAHGAYITQVCDRRGAVLGHVRWTILGEPKSWCSRRCRDGVDHQPGNCRGCGTPLGGKRRGAMYCGRTCRMRTVRRAIQESGNPLDSDLPCKWDIDLWLSKSKCNTTSIAEYQELAASPLCVDTVIRKRQQNTSSVAAKDSGNLPKNPPFNQPLWDAG